MMSRIVKNSKKVIFCCLVVTYGLIMLPIMTGLFHDLSYVLVYIDDILIIQKGGETEDDHLQKVEEVLKRLKDKGFRANLRKSFFMQQEVEYLGYLLTSDGIEPQQKKIEAIKRIKPPKNPKQFRSFLGLVNFYRDLWPKRSHLLGPLSKVSSCTPKNWVWGRDQQKAFEKVKEMIQKEALLQYPDFTKYFDLFFTDASDFQLGATLVQKPLVFFTRKLNSAQRNYYSVGEKEL